MNDKSQPPGPGDSIWNWLTSPLPDDVVRFADVEAKAQDEFDDEERRLEGETKNADLPKERRQRAEEDLASFHRLRKESDDLSHDLACAGDLRAWLRLPGRRRLFKWTCVARNLWDPAEGAGATDEEAPGALADSGERDGERDGEPDEHLKSCSYCRIVVRLAGGRARRVRYGRLLRGDQLVEEYVNEACDVFKSPAACDALKVWRVRCLTDVLDRAQKLLRAEPDDLPSGALDLLGEMAAPERPAEAFRLRSPGTRSPGTAPAADSWEAAMLGQYLRQSEQFAREEYGGLGEHLFHAAVRPAAEQLIEAVKRQTQIVVLAASGLAFAEAAPAPILGVVDAIDEFVAALQTSRRWRDVAQGVRDYFAGFLRPFHLAAPEAAPEVVPEAAPERVQSATLRDLVFVVAEYLRGPQGQPQPVAPAVGLHLEAAPPGTFPGAGASHSAPRRQPPQRIRLDRADRGENDWVFVILHLPGRLPMILDPVRAYPGEPSVRIELPPDLGNDWRAEVFIVLEDPKKIPELGNNTSRPGLTWWRGDVGPGRAATS